MIRSLFTVVVLLLAPLLAGCGGPIATPGTQGLPPEQLAVIHVKQHGCMHEWNGQAVHIDNFLVGGVEFVVRGDTDFLVSPGEHTFTVDYGPCIHDLRGLGNPTESVITGGPYGNFKATIEPGAEYLLMGEEKLTGGNAAQAVHSLKLLKPGNAMASHAP